MKEYKEKKYTLREVSEIFNISIQTLKYRCMANNYYPYSYNGMHQYALTPNQMLTVVSKKTEPTDVIYVTRTTEIYQSKLNFLTLEQL